MNQLERYGLPLAFILNFFAVGVPYWLTPYNKVNLPNALMEWGLLFVGVSALILCAGKLASFRKIIVIVGISVPAAVFIRVVVKGVQDPTSHNLWPLEIIIAVVVGFVCALMGAAVGCLAASLRAKYIRGQKS